MPKKYAEVKHKGMENRIDEAKRQGSKPEVRSNNKITHVVAGDAEAVKHFEEHVKKFEESGKRKEMGAMNKPF